MLYLAIDQHRKQLTVNLRNELGDVLLKRQVSTEWPRVRKFLEEVQQQSQAEGGFVVILEVCGFNDWLIKLLAEYDCGELILIQPGLPQLWRGYGPVGLDHQARQRYGPLHSRAVSAPRLAS